MGLARPRGSVGARVELSRVAWTSPCRAGPRSSGTGTGRFTGAGRRVHFGIRREQRPRGQEIRRPFGTRRLTLPSRSVPVGFQRHGGIVVATAIKPRRGPVTVMAKAMARGEMHGTAAIAPSLSYRAGRA